MWLPIRFKIIVPFTVLLVFVGIIGSGVTTARLTDAAAAEFDANLLHSSLLANQSVAQTEAARLADLRLGTDTVGVAESLAAGDVSGLTQLLKPIAANVTTASTSRAGESRTTKTRSRRRTARPAPAPRTSGWSDLPS